jgi:hypothetical protein
MHKGMSHVLKLMMETTIKVDIFSAAWKKKKDPPMDTPKPRMALFQGEEDDVAILGDYLKANCNNKVAEIVSDLINISAKPRMTLFQGAEDDDSMTSHVLSALPITPLGSSDKISEFESNLIIVGSKSIEMENIGNKILEANGTMLRKLIFKGANIPEKEKPAVGISSSQILLSGAKLCKNTKFKKY